MRRVHAWWVVKPGGDPYVLARATKQVPHLPSCLYIHHPFILSPRSTTQCHAAPHSITQHYAALRTTTQYHAVPRSSTQYHAAPRSSTQLHAASCDTMQHHILSSHNLYHQSSSYFFSQVHSLLIDDNV